MSKMSRRIVVDASVARAAGSTENPASKRSREFLEAMRTVCHRVVMTPDIRREWRNHKSAFSISWLAAMSRRRKVVEVVVDAQREKLLVRTVLASGLGKKQKREAEKDCLLISAALAADRIVASSDVEARKLFATVAATLSDVAAVMWVDPIFEPGLPVAWLEAGARTENARMLANKPSAG
jgi:hypothetical protein